VEQGASVDRDREGEAEEEDVDLEGVLDNVWEKSEKSSVRNMLSRFATAGEGRNGGSGVWH
jgi:hypothetical protein